MPTFANGFAVHDPPRYAPTPELCVITSYYNPCGYKTRRDNYDIFVGAMRRSGIQCLTVECAFGDEPFELPETPDTIQVRSKTLLWQKERLLNLAASWLPRHYKYVAWIDCDVIFTNLDWAQDTTRLLETHAVVQLFETCRRLDSKNEPGNTPDEVTSFAAIAPQNPHLLSCGRFDRHGHTGYGWAMRREIFNQVGLYEYAIVGTADHYMAHAIYNEYGFCIQYATKRNACHIRHLREWGKRFYALAGNSLAATPGTILHLWHGNLMNRRYGVRTQEISDLGYDPYADIIAAPGRPLHWHPDINKPALVKYFADYFRSRREDG